MSAQLKKIRMIFGIPGFPLKLSSEKVSCDLNVPVIAETRLERCSGCKRCSNKNVRGYRDNERTDMEVLVLSS